MKYLALVTLTLLAFALGAPVEESQELRVNGENGWYVPQLDGSFEWVSVEEAFGDDDDDDDDDDDESDDLESAVDKRHTAKVGFYLYTRSNPEEPQQIKPTHKSIKESNFNKDHPTRFITHGWTESYEADLNVFVRDAWLSRGEYNIIAVDWSSRSRTVYSKSVKYVPVVGETVANMIDFLHTEFGMSFDTLTLIGHSLGAHVCGFAGKKVKQGRVDTIIGLDPAMPLYSFSSPSKRLSDEDARYVESIHTNGGKLGFLKPIGRSAFYPNGGSKQPGCGLDASGTCSHSRSYIYYAEAVASNTFPSIKCAHYKAAVKKDCGATYSSVHMGAQSNAIVAAGHFYVPVNKKPPFGKGF